MIRFDTFRFDYDTKNVIVFSCAVAVLLVRHALLLTQRNIDTLLFSTLKSDARQVSIFQVGRGGHAYVENQFSFVFILMINIRLSFRLW
jgi:hypothetical protein